MGKAAKTAVIGVIFSSLIFGALGMCTRYFQNDCGLSSSDIVVIRLDCIKKYGKYVLPLIKFTMGGSRC